MNLKPKAFAASPCSGAPGTELAAGVPDAVAVADESWPVSDGILSNSSIASWIW